MPKLILLDPGTTQWMLPRGRTAIPCVGWHDSKDRFDEFAELEMLRRGIDTIEDGIDVVVALVPRPDNDYNPLAISVAQPATYGLSHVDRHIGYVRDRDHGSLGGGLFHELARAGLGAEIGCHARLAIDSFRGGVLTMLLPSPQRVTELIEEFLTRPDDPGARRRVTAVLAERDADRIPPARAEQAAALEERAAPQAEFWQRVPLGEAIPGSVRVQQRNVFGRHKVYLVNGEGGRIGEMTGDTVFLTDERYRTAARQALEESGFPQPPGDDSEWFPDARIVEHRHAKVTAHRSRWLLLPRTGGDPIGWFDPADRVLRVHAEAYREGARILMARHGVTPAAVRWAPPEPDPDRHRLHGANPLAGLAPERSREIVDQQTWRMGERHRALLPADLAGLSPLRWTSADQNSVFATEDTYWLHNDSRYVSCLEALLGPHDHGHYQHTQRPVPCRLCGGDALEAIRRDEPGARPLAYCRGCLGKATSGMLFDHGRDEPWHELAIWALREIAGEFGGPPSQAQIPRLLSTTDPAAADRAMLVRMHVPRVPQRRGALREPQRAPLTWTDWLNRAGLLSDGLVTPRGTVTVATDGHLCRSLLERHIDDFLAANGIGHTTEPDWPYDAELNTTGMRADWLLDDGTYVEAWGLADEADYAEKMVRKQRLAVRTGLRLVGVTATDLGRLHDVFAPWLRDD
ncbi:hypothetical protein AB0F72_20030 [Actinoplanes sp. NPDC023936]|uniref:hypothetical protein n=1 Tax=Actinoplanes sp. NPDC023936 TaxID=3154910 RepID=UPI0033D734FC